MDDQISRQKLIMAIANWQMTLMPGWSSANDTDTVIHNTLEEVIGLIESQPPADQWIPCSERLPDDQSKLYWTTHEDGSVIQHGYCKGLGFIYNWEVDDLEKRKRQGDVIAWMPNEKPEPYKGVE